MKKIIVVCLLLAVMGCAMMWGEEPSYRSRTIPSVNPNANCRFISALYIMAMPYNMIPGVQMNVEKAGGNSYKITNTTPVRRGGFEMVDVNFEVYRCE